MKLDNFRIVKIDEFNITFEEFKGVKNKKDNTIGMKWVRVGGYYGSLEHCLNALKNYIISKYINIDSVDTVLEQIDKINGAIVSCKLEVDNNV